ncbi:PTS system D-fructose-specific IIA component, partial [human gut metagenome]
MIDAADESAKSIDDRLSDTGITTEEKKGFKLLAVTSCPTGIAHTYMAAEALEKAARAADCQIKIETRGSAGAKNVLTAEEIEAADCIIVAADAKVPMDRFNGKKVISCQVSDGIGKADQLVKQAMSGNVEVFHGESSETTTAVTGKESAAHKIYTQLMNGVSHMLPFVVGGGILIAIAFLIDGLNVDINALPADQRSNFGTITPIAAMFKNIGGVAFGLML